MGGVSPKGLAHNPLSESNRKAHSSVNNIQEKTALEDGICEKALCAPESTTCFHGGGGIGEAPHSCSASFLKGRLLSVTAPDIATPAKIH